MTSLLWSKGYDARCVVVDRPTKLRHLIPTTTAITAEELGTLFCDRLFRYHGLLDFFGPRAAIHLPLLEIPISCLKIDRRLLTAFHPQTDGQTEQVKVMVE